MDKKIIKSSGKKGVDKNQALTNLQEISDDKRHALIAEAAYHLAEQRGFEGDASLDDWLQAEAEIDAHIASGG